MGDNARPKVILITGASSGFGYLASLRLASAGHIVYATMRDVSKGQSLLADATRKNCSKKLKILPLDVTKIDSIKDAVAEIVADQGVIDVLVNNAGYGVGGFFEDLTPEDIQQQFDVNYFGVLNVTREVIPVMRPRRQGKIINVSSMAAFSGTPCFSAYCSSKWALEGFSESLQMELKPFCIDVVLVEPGSYRTKIFEENARFAKKFNNESSPYHEHSVKLRNMVLDHVKASAKDPEDVAKTIEHIVETSSPSFRYIVGWDQRLRILFFRIIPFKAYSWMIRKALLSQ